MKKLLLIFIMMATWMVVGCGTSTIGCFGHWVKGPGHHRGTRTLLIIEELELFLKMPIYLIINV